MTYEEAIEYFENELKEMGNYKFPTKEMYAYSLAIAVIKKQVPMKGNKTITYIRHCPKCKCVLSSSFKYCDECGQRILWDDEK